MKKVFIETYGCQMNEYDTELVRAILESEKYQFVDQEDDADVIMLNTCAIRENAHRKIYGKVHRIHHDRSGKKHGAKQVRPVKIGILGCMATNLRQDLLKNNNLAIDFIAGPDSYKKLPQLITESYGQEYKPFDVTLSEFETYSDVHPSRKEGMNAWIAVMRGCDNFCTFCVVPYTRGRERSRTVENVVDEAKRLADEGFKQITLLGQNVNSYKTDNHDFADLMEAVANVDGIERVRFTSPHPKDFPIKLLELIQHHPNICKQVHMPLQSGNDRILELMNRTYTQREFLDLIATTRKICPDIAISTDVIVGFSTETDEEFEDTYKVMEQVEFDAAFMFKYSERQGTIAKRKYPDDVPEAIKTERIVRLNELQRPIILKKNREHIGQELDVMVELLSTPKSDQECQGRTDGNKTVVFAKNDSYQLGDIVKMRITDASVSVLKGEELCQK